MRKQPTGRIVFSAEEIEIVQNDSGNESISEIYIPENKAGFNLLFLLSSDIFLEALGSHPKFLFRKNQYILYYSPEKKNSELWTEGGESLKYLHIQLSYRYISQLLSPESNQENAEIMRNMVDNHFVFLHKETPPDMTVEMHMILNEIVNSTKKGILQKLFIEAKISKLLILILEQFNEQETLESIPKTPEMIRKFIDENYHRNIKAEEIGKLIGMNQNTIRKEFKAQYHTTIAHYMSELRMLKAKKMIADKEIMIKEIAIECGYEYLQNFTRAFKKRFGISPEHLRNNK
ncbi:helix-turn-helix transcriptional regulator [Chryseobacterium lactis]|uniref:helix-turn-helix transcriptional regulator n=1 Tax=Chryseobacterium lactis TaxID=1241981 RepID=UPI001629A852|nr:AraC family transcriptional regulator [Chryseobacterium lactis]